jgi:8-oxo-dGTP diphosphatase
MHATEKKKNLVKVVALALQRKSDGRYLITRRGPGQSGAGEWEFAGGKIEAGESQVQALVREIKEELCLELFEKDLTFVAENIEHYPEKSVHIFLWRCVIENQPQIVLTEHDEMRWLSRDELKGFGLSRGDQPFISFL